MNFASEDDLARWDNSTEPREIFGRMRPHAEGEPEDRRLSSIDEWFLGPAVPSSTVVPRWKTAVVTWLGIWPLASLVLWLVAPVWSDLGLTFLLSMTINVALIVLGMVFVSPLLTKATRWFSCHRGCWDGGTAVLRGRRVAPVVRRLRSLLRRAKGGCP